MLIYDHGDNTHKCLYILMHPFAECLHPLIMLLDLHKSFTQLSVLNDDLTYKLD